MGYEKLKNFCQTYHLTMVTLIEDGSAYGYTVEELVKLSNEQKYPTEKPAEGIVIRSKEPFLSQILKKSWSGKVINEFYKE
jgi:hypothetical protein